MVEGCLKYLQTEFQADPPGLRAVTRAQTKSSQTGLKSFGWGPGFDEELLEIMEPVCYVATNGCVLGYCPSSPRVFYDRDLR